MAILGHGVDIVAIDRIGELIDRHGERFTRRCFTAEERAYAQAGGGLCPQRYAARFAAKEAAFKALGSGLRAGLSWVDVAVSRDDWGKPSLIVTGQAEQRARRLGVRRWLVSLSHAGGMAMASVIAEGESSANR